MQIFQHSSDTLFNQFKKEVQHEADKDTRDVLIHCKNGEYVETTRRLLCLSSPLLRKMFGDVQDSDDVDRLHLPDFSRRHVLDALNVLQMKWSQESDVWSGETVEILESLDIKLPFRNKQADSFNNDTRDQDAEISDEVDHEDDDTIISKQGNDDSERTSEAGTPSKVSDVKCPLCSKITLR